jgi:hypothetical protein
MIGDDMRDALFSLAPPQALLPVGGFLCVRPSGWAGYLDEIAKVYYPEFFLDEQLRVDAEKLSQENSCILDSVEKYLFKQFGAAVPKENLFKFYNPRGEGISPDRMLEAIAAIIEPLGFEVDAVLAPDHELRLGLGMRERVYGMDNAQYFHGKPGICMINIEIGYSHAFYWNSMDRVKFSREQFRIAILLRRRAGFTQPSPSVFEGLKEYTNLLKTYTAAEEGTSTGIQEVRNQAECLELHLQQGTGSNPSFWQNINENMEKLLTVIENSVNPLKLGGERADLLEAGKLLLRVLTEKEESHFAVQS